MAIAQRSTTATVDDLCKTAGKAELVDGHLVLMPPTGVIPGHAALEIVIRLREQVLLLGYGQAFGDNIGFVVDLPNRQSFSPDAAFCTDKQKTMKFFQGAPTFAVEVRSENDYGQAAERSLQEKRRDYFTAGTQVVWDVDMQSDEVITSYRTEDPDRPTVYRRDQWADAEPAVPGWRMLVDELFID